MSDDNNGKNPDPADKRTTGHSPDTGGATGGDRDRASATGIQSWFRWGSGKQAEKPPLDPNHTELLNPHRFQSEVQLLEVRNPRVLITPQAYRCMCLYVEIALKEVGWMGTVSRTADGDFLIEETYLLDQLVHSTETELAAEDIGKLTMSLIDSGTDGLEKANKLRFWGHSHVRMGTSPSGTDEATMERFGREKMPWYVRGIFNKEGRGEFTIYLYDRGLRINDAEWQVWDPNKKTTILQGRSTWNFFAPEPMPGPTFGSNSGPKPLAPSRPVPKELKPGARLRASVEAEFAAKVKERKSFWEYWKPEQGAGEGAQNPESTDASTELPAKLDSDTLTADSDLANWLAGRNPASTAGPTSQPAVNPIRPVGDADKSE